MRIRIVRKWMEDIRTKTKHMNREQKWEYVLMYYWYHILLGAILLGLVILLIYHIVWGRNRKPDFTCVIVNQEVDFPRDAEIAEEFSSFSGIGAKKLSIDSDYLISYEDVRLPEANESSYEKFFFNWSSGLIDVMVLPESFYEYCLKLGGEFCDLREILPAEKLDCLEEQMNPECGQEYRRIYIEGTALEGWLQTEEGDPPVLVVPVEMKHKELSGKFLEYVLEEYTLERRSE